MGIEPKVEEPILDAGQALGSSPTAARDQRAKWGLTWGNVRQRAATDMSLGPESAEAV
jgi:hypothetical protein